MIVGVSRVIILLIGASLALLGLMLGFRLIGRLCSGGSCSPGSSAEAPPRPQPRQRSGGGGTLALVFLMLPIAAVTLYLFTARSVQLERHRRDLQVAERQRAVAEKLASTQRVTALDRPAIQLDQAESAPAEETAKPKPGTDPQTTELLSQVSSIITKIRSSRVPLASVELLRQLEQFQTALYDGVGADEAEQKVIPTTAEAPLGPPEWVIDSTRDADLRVVISKPRASEKAAMEEAMEAAAAAVLEDYSKHMVGLDAAWRPRLENLPSAPVQKRYTEQIPWNYFAESGDEAQATGPGLAYRTYLEVRVGPEIRSEVYAQWKNDVQHRRLEAVAAVALGLVLIVAALAGYYRLDNRTNGNWRWTLRLGSLAAVGFITVAVLSEAGPELSRALENHIGPASTHPARRAHEQPAAPQSSATATASRTAELPESPFLGVPVQGRKVAFVVLGDKQFAGGTKLEQLNEAITGCLQGFKNVQFKVVCQSSTGRKIASGEIRNGRVRGGGLRNVKWALDRCFTDDAESIHPVDAVRTVSWFRPDTVVVVRDAAAAVDPDQKLAGSTLSEIFDRTGTTVHAVEIGEQADARVSMSDLASRTGGEYVLWSEPAGR